MTVVSLFAVRIPTIVSSKPLKLPPERPPAVSRQAPRPSGLTAALTPGTLKFRSHEQSDTLGATAASSAKAVWAVHDRAVDSEIAWMRRPRHFSSRPPAVELRLVSEAN